MHAAHGARPGRAPPRAPARAAALCIDACPEPYGLRARTGKPAAEPRQASVRPRRSDVPDVALPLPASAAARDEGHVRLGHRRAARRLPALLRLSDHALDRGRRADGEAAAEAGRRLRAGRERGGRGQPDVRLRRRRPAVADLHLVARLQPDAGGALVHDRRRAARRLRGRDARRAPASATSRPSSATSSSPAAASATATPTRSCSRPRRRRRCSTSPGSPSSCPSSYRNPVVVLADGYLGQMTGQVRLPRTLVKPGLPGLGRVRRRRPPAAT